MTRQCAGCGFWLPAADFALTVGTRRRSCCGQCCDTADRRTVEIGVLVTAAWRRYAVAVLHSLGLHAAAVCMDRGSPWPTLAQARRMQYELRLRAVPRQRLP